jgi:hypothetical protein
MALSFWTVCSHVPTQIGTPRTSIPRHIHFLTSTAGPLYTCPIIPFQAILIHDCGAAASYLPLDLRTPPDEKHRRVPVRGIPVKTCQTLHQVILLLPPSRATPQETRTMTSLLSTPLQLTRLAHRSQKPGPAPLFGLDRGPVSMEATALLYLEPSKR